MKRFLAAFVGAIAFVVVLTLIQVFELPSWLYAAVFGIAVWTVLSLSQRPRK